jgi:hypothetical protein
MCGVYIFVESAYTYTQRDVCVWVYTYIHAYTHTHTYTHRLQAAGLAVLPPRFSSLGVEFTRGLVPYQLRLLVQNFRDGFGLRAEG